MIILQIQVWGFGFIQAFKISNRQDGKKGEFLLLITPAKAKTCSLLLRSGALPLFLFISIEVPENSGHQVHK